MKKKKKRFAIKSLIFYALPAIVFVISALFVYFQWAKAGSVNLYAGTCLGSWQNPHLAQGQPDVSDIEQVTSDILTINKKNSAIFSEGGIKEIYCGSFNGDLSESEIKLIKSVNLKFSWLINNDVNTTIADNPNSNNWTAPATSSTAGASAIWTSGTTKGLGFRLKQTGTVANTYSTAWWGTDDTSGNALYSGISTSTAAQKIANSVWVGSGTDEKTTVEYKVDVFASQKTGDYTSSPIIYTVLAN